MLTSDPKTFLYTLPFHLIFQGVLLSVPETMEEVSCMKTLWIHEVARVFGDRLVDSPDRQWLLSKVEDACTKHLQTDFHQLLQHLKQDKDGKVKAINARFLHSINIQYDLR